jgi:aminopeptidase N
MRDWLATGHLPAGLDLHPEVRWQLLLRLVVLGAAGRQEIEHAAARDASAIGRENAERCLAAIADQAAKQAAWTALFGPRSIRSPSASGHLLAATAQGFWQADQAELLSGYAPRYFPAVTEIAIAAGAEALVIARHGFPYHMADEPTLSAGQQCLQTGGLNPALRRLLADQLDDMHRAMNRRNSLT